MVSGNRQAEPLTPALSPEGRGGESSGFLSETPISTSPLRGEVGAQRRVRGSVSRARALRSNSTDAENRLWQKLRARQMDGHKFVRQMAIGPYFADFACRERALIIELDGGQHANLAHDEIRTAYLNDQGYSVLRFWNNEVLDNIDGVQVAIVSTLALNPSPDLRFAPATLSPQGRGALGALAATTKKRSYRLNADQTHEQSA
ncbi:MAG: endonuclease domain-containing protein [Devosia sp.]|nr:endonuclease domain-containing protein [Devosia sp.]